ncbi:MAG: hypothetical protein KBI01_08175 [Oscillospiraceae bacterium]|nr:hypothetical protein [Oscillospiraceae bacterium]
MTAGLPYYDSDVDDLGYGVTSIAAAGANTTVVSSSSVYVVYDSTYGTATLYTGSTGLPSTATAGSVDNTKVVMTANSAAVGTANYIFVTQAGGFSAATTTNFVYIESALYSTSLNASGSTVYSYTGVKADGTTITLTSTGDALDNAGIYSYTTTNTVADANELAAVGSTADAAHAAGYIYDATLTVVGSMVSVTSTTTPSEVFYNITADTKVVYIKSTLASVDGNGGYVVRASVNGTLTANAAVIFITVD